MKQRGKGLRGPARLFADLYELTMLGAYGARGMDATATFSLFVRELPTAATSSSPAASTIFLATLKSSASATRTSPICDTPEYASGKSVWCAVGFPLRRGRLRAPEGTPIFPGEPILEITAPIGQAQAVETLVVNQISLQTVLASKAARVVEAAAGRPVVDFGARRAQGLDAALKGARAFAIAGVSATSLLAAGARYRIPSRERWRTACASVRRRARGFCSLRGNLPEHGPAGRYLRHAQGGAPRDRTRASARRRLPVNWCPA